jgi:hypothetical protein
VGLVEAAGCSFRLEGQLVKTSAKATADPYGMKDRNAKSQTQIPFGNDNQKSPWGTTSKKQNSDNSFHAKSAKNCRGDATQN